MSNQGEYRFDVEFLEESLKFLEKLDEKTQEKVLENIRVSRFKNDSRLLKKIDKDIWEFRSQYKSQQIRLLAFWDKERKSLIVCAHGFIKKTQKIPSRELSKAKNIRLKYLNSNRKS